MSQKRLNHYHTLRWNIPDVSNNVQTQRNQGNGVFQVVVCGYNFWENMSWYVKHG